jgi:hypothetical protein
MSLCYDFQKWTILTLGLIAISLSFGLVLQYAHGQSQQLTPEQAEKREIQRCTIYNDSTLAVVNLDPNSSCTNLLGAIAYYSSQGYEIKAVISNSLFMQKMIK